MILEEVGTFIAKALDRPERYWDRDALSELAGLSVPDGLLGTRGTLLRADLHTLWARWFLESICDPEPFVLNDRGYAHVFVRVRARTEALFPSVPADERDLLARKLAHFVDAEIRRRQLRGRSNMSVAIRERLWDEYGPSPRCWWCGAGFEPWAVDRFLGRSSQPAEPQLPAFVDFLRPRGLKRRDLCIEIDHVTPVVVGGGGEGDNLRLACGWCNAAKSGHVSIYDVTGQMTSSFLHPSLGALSIPRPFWVVRIVGTRRRCEWNGGCARTLGNAELTVIPAAEEGALNPLNLRVTCQDHDAYGAQRLVARERCARA